MLFDGILILLQGKFDFEEKYQEDAIYEELGSKARVWRANLDECEEYDNDMVIEARDGLDLLLVFVCMSLSAFPQLIISIRLACFLPVSPLSSLRRHRRFSTTFPPFLHPFCSRWSRFSAP